MDFNQILQSRDIPDVTICIKFGVEKLRGSRLYGGSTLVSPSETIGRPYNWTRHRHYLPWRSNFRSIPSRRQASRRSESTTSWRWFCWRRPLTAAAQHLSRNCAAEDQWVRFCHRRHHSTSRTRPRSAAPSESPSLCKCRLLGHIMAAA